MLKTIEDEKPMQTEPKRNTGVKHNSLVEEEGRTGTAETAVAWTHVGQKTEGLERQSLHSNEPKERE